MTDAALWDEAIAELFQQISDQASGAKISSRTIDAARHMLVADDAVLQQSEAQPEHSITAKAYVNRIVTTDRIQTGQSHAARLAEVLSTIEAAYRVPPSILLAIWGIELNFGENTGQSNVIQSLSNLCCRDQRRAQFWKSELIAALQIIDRGSISAGELLGSWAGAMGHVQFMPTTYLNHAVDHDDDGFADIWQSIPDALASAANYLIKCGWQAGLPWGAEVGVDDTFNFADHDIGKARRFADWQCSGIRPDPPGSQKSNSIPANEPCRLITPAGTSGPAFLVTPNFDVLLHYNRSTIYALSVGCLADRINGNGPLLTPWPDEIALTRQERIELQQLLNNFGLDTNGLDGIFGPGTQQATQAFQRQHGLIADGHPTAELLRFVRNQTRATDRLK